MTDVKPANTPNKRKSFANDGNKPQSAKKTKPNNQATPKKTVNGTPNKQMQTPNKQKQTPFKQNESAKKAKQTPNKPPVKKFGGTATLSPKVPQEGSVSPKIQKKPINKPKQEKQKGQPKQLKGPINPKKLEKQTGEGRKRRTLYPVIIQKIKSGEKKEALADIEQRIADLEKRSEKTKTSIRKLKLLKRLRKLSDGTAEQKVQIDKKQANVPQVKAKAQNANNKTVKQGAKPVQNKPGKKTQLVIKKDEDSEEKLEDSDGEEDDSEEGDEESDEGEEDSDEGEGDSDDDEEDSDEDGDEIENSANEEVKKVQNAPTPKNIKTNNENKPNNKSSKQKDISLDQLKKDSLVKSDQKRYVLFVGNISYDTNKDELNEHFKKVGEIRHIRVPTDQKTNRPRGFAYVEVTNEESYQKCLSLHHSSLKGRRINVEYTQGGKKKGDDRKKEIKAKNFKLHAMRKQGQLVGSQKQSQKRTFRRNKKNVKHDE